MNKTSEGAFIPRQVGLGAPGTLRHAIVRGIERRRIVSDEKDRQNFVAHLGDLAEETKTQVLGKRLGSPQRDLIEVFWIISSKRP